MDRARAGRDGEKRLRPENIHLQVRRQSLRRLVVFVIDTSDSMGEGPTARISAALGASLSILARAHLNRDQVCLITFRAEKAQVVVPPTGSTQRLRQQMRQLPVGGATPLADGLRKAFGVVRQARLRAPGSEPVVVLFSDGEANVPVNQGTDPEIEAIATARAMHGENIPALVIDTGSTLRAGGLMPRLAEAFGTVSRNIHALQSGQLLQLIEQTRSRHQP